MPKVLVFSSYACELVCVYVLYHMYVSIYSHTWQLRERVKEWKWRYCFNICGGSFTAKYIISIEMKIIATISYKYMLEQPTCTKMVRPNVVRVQKIQSSWILYKSTNSIATLTIVGQSFDNRSICPRNSTPEIVSPRKEKQW